MSLKFIWIWEMSLEQRDSYKLSYHDDYHDNDPHNRCYVNICGHIASQRHRNLPFVSKSTF